jgi:uncharacterized protein YbbK (DUF523 family)
MSRPILVSACLLGLSTRYDGQAKGNAKVLDYLTANDRLPIPVCPEQLAGLPTPRPATCFAEGDGVAVLAGAGAMVNRQGERMDEAFRRGARETLYIARLTGCREALLKERSPSCGVHRVYLGNQLVAGSGVASALLEQAGIKIISEADL